MQVRPLQVENDFDITAGMEGVETSNTVELLPYGMSYQSSELNTPDDLSRIWIMGRLKAVLAGA